MTRSVAAWVLALALLGCLGLMSYAGWWLSHGTEAAPAPLRLPPAGTLSTPAATPLPAYARYLREAHGRARGVLHEYNDRYPQESGPDGLRKIILLAREMAARAREQRRELQAHPPPPEAARAYDSIDRFLENTSAQLELTAEQTRGDLDGAPPNPELLARGDELFRRKEALFREMDEELARLP